MYEVSYTKTAERYLKKIKDKQLLKAFKTANGKINITSTLYVDVIYDVMI